MIIPMRALTKGIMLGLLLIPLAAVINMDNAFAESFTVDLCVGGASQDNKCFYVPEKIMINVGDTVIWTNSDSATHTVTSGDVNDPNTWGLILESGLGKAGSTFEHTFDTAGEYPYLCQLHPWAVGKVVVLEAMKEPPYDMAAIIEPILITKPELIDEVGNPLTSVVPDTPIGIETELVNTTGEKIVMTYIVQVKDSEGVAVFLTWIRDLPLPPNEIAKPGIFWKPSKSGDYSIEVFVWESTFEPTPLSSHKRISISVE